MSERNQGSGAVAPDLATPCQRKAAVQVGTPSESKVSSTRKPMTVTYSVLTRTKNAIHLVDPEDGGTGYLGHRFSE